MSRQKYLGIIVLLFISIVLHAQDGTQNLPSLNNHTFIPSSIIGSPFTNSYFRSGIGIASSSTINYPLFELDGETIYGELGGLLMVQMGVSYQQKVKDWIAFNIEVGLSARVGTDITTLLARGVNSVTGMEMNWVIKLMQNERQMLSGTVSVSNYSGTFISIAGFVEDIINNNPNPSLSKSIPVVNSGIGLRYAYGINDLFGFHFTGNLSYGEGFSRSDAGFSYKIGGSLEMNIAERSKAPLGFVLWFLRSTQPENVYNETDPTQLFGMKIAYTGTSDFSIGIEFTYVILPVSVIDEKLGLFGGLITTRYYFN